MTIHHINLKEFDNIPDAMASVPPCTTYVDLSHNALGTRTVAELTEIFAALRSEVTTLDLGWCHLGGKNEGELRTMLKAIPDTVMDIKVDYNNFAEWQHRIVEESTLNARMKKQKKSNFKPAKAEPDSLLAAALGLFSTSDDEAMAPPTTHTEEAKLSHSA